MLTCLQYLQSQRFYSDKKAVAQFTGVKGADVSFSFLSRLPPPAVLADVSANADLGGAKSRRTVPQNRVAHRRANMSTRASTPCR